MESNEKPKLKYRVEYRIVKALGALLNALPYPVAQSVACGIGRIVFWAMSKRRREAERRIAATLSNAECGVRSAELGDSENSALRIPNSELRVSAIAWVSLRNTVLNMVDMLRVKKMTLADIEALMPNLDECVAELRGILEKTNGRGLILALPHMGNWDLAGSGCFLSGLPIFSVAGKQRNPLMNDLINEWRSGHGMDIIERGGGTLRQIITRIRGGQIFAILPDTRSFQPDIKVPFLGGEANLARGMASFALATDVPVVPLIIRRVKRRRFEVEMFPAIWPDKSADKNDEIRRITFDVISIIDAAIRKTPEQWFWYNKRWVLDPVEEN